MSSVVETVTNLVTPILDENHFELVDVEFVKEGKSWYLRVYIDALVSDKLSEKLDSCDPDPIPQAYYLEVSSPGAERPLKKEKDYERALNKYIHISLYQAIDGQKVYEGTMVDLNKETLTLEYRVKTRTVTKTFDRNKIAKARLAIKF